MSRAYKDRHKTIRRVKKSMNVRVIPEKDFAFMQAAWSREIAGPPIGMLEDLIMGRLPNA